MAILLSEEIKSLALQRGTPLFKNDFDAKQLASCGYDLRVGAVFKDGKIYSDDHNKDDSWDVEIKPSEIVTILTLEELRLPSNMIASVFAINSLSSAGFLILNPGHIDPGYEGPVSICAVNLSKRTRHLYRGMPIFTIIFDSLGKDAVPYPNNKTYTNRKQREEVFSREKASMLSKSFFDLILKNQYPEHFKNLIEEVVKRVLYRWIAGIALLIGIAAGVVKLWPATSDQTSQKTIDSLKTLLQSQVDSPRTHPTENITLTDTIQ